MFTATPGNCYKAETSGIVLWSERECLGADFPLIRARCARKLRDVIVISVTLTTWDELEPIKQTVVMHMLAMEMGSSHQFFPNKLCALCKRITVFPACDLGLQCPSCAQCII